MSLIMRFWLLPVAGVLATETQEGVLALEAEATEEDQGVELNSHRSHSQSVTTMASGVKRPESVSNHVNINLPN